jgi:hypothetical protein
MHKTIIKDHFKTQTLELLESDVFINNNDTLKLFEINQNNNNLFQNEINLFFNQKNNNFNLTSLNLELEHDNVVSLLETCKMSTITDHAIKKIKFKPGYQRM